MKLNHISLFLACFISGTIFGQNQVLPQQTGSENPGVALGPTSYLGIAAGPALPLGKYKDSAYARIGVDVALNIEYTLTHSTTAGYGIGFKLDYGFNSINTVALQNDFNNQLQQETHNPNYSGVLIGNGNLAFYAAYLGLYATYPKGRFSIDWHILVGAMFAETPDILLNIYNNGSEVGTGGTPASDAVGVSLDLGAGMRYMPLNSFCFTFKLDFLYANPSFSAGTATVTPGGPNGVTITQNTFNQVFVLVNFGFGIAWIPSHKDFSDKKK